MLLHRHLLGAIEAIGAPRQSDNFQFRRGRSRVPSRRLKGKAQGIQLHIGKFADFQPHPPHPAKTVLPGLAGDGVNDSFTKRKFVHGGVQWG